MKLSTPLLFWNVYHLGSSVIGFMSNTFLNTSKFVRRSKALQIRINATICLTSLGIISPKSPLYLQTNNERGTAIPSSIVHSILQSSSKSYISPILPTTDTSPK